MMTEKPSIFIASSSEALPLARLIQGRLEDLKGFDNGTVFKDVVLWEESVRLGRGFPEILRNKFLEVDMGVVLFTEDDLTCKKGIERHAPRDNCIFEAGFLSGTLGVDYTRCFLVCGIDRDALPTDLQGLQHIKINDFDLKDQDGCGKAAAYAVRKIGEELSKWRNKCYERPVVSVITTEQLLALETPEMNGSGGGLVAGAVIVHAPDPLEQGYEFANRVMSNMKSDIKYQYVFEGNKEHVSSIWSVIVAISQANLIRNGQFPRNKEEQLALMTGHVQEVRNNLDKIKNKLSIHFVSDPVPIAFCVHNAKNIKKARSFLRYKMIENNLPVYKFIEWYKGDPEQAKKIADGICCQCLDDSSHPWIFRSTRNFRLYGVENSDFLAELEKGISENFPEELLGVVREVCFDRRRYALQAKAS